MAGPEIAQYGIGFFSVAGLLYLVSRAMEIWSKKGGKSNTQEDTGLREVVENNTRAMEQLTNILQVNMARQEAKIDEVVAYVRRCS